MTNIHSYLTNKFDLTGWTTLINIHTYISLLEIGIVRTEAYFFSELLIFDSDHAILYQNIIAMFCNVYRPCG